MISFFAAYFCSSNNN